MAALEEALEKYRRQAERFFTVAGAELEGEEPALTHARRMHEAHEEIMHLLGAQRAPSVGARFLHQHFINDDGTPKECLITRITAAEVYYRCGGLYFIRRHQFSTVVKIWVK